MPAPKVVLESIGPLPVTATFESPGVGPAALFVSGSAFGTRPENPLRIEWVDHEPILISPDFDGDWVEFSGEEVQLRYRGDPGEVMMAGLRNGSCEVEMIAWLPGRFEVGRGRAVVEVSCGGE